MSDSNPRSRPTCTWVSVEDESGRIHLEAHWGTVEHAHIAAA